MNRVWFMDNGHGLGNWKLRLHSGMGGWVGRDFYDASIANPELEASLSMAGLRDPAVSSRKLKAQDFKVRAQISESLLALMSEYLITCVEKARSSQGLGQIFQI